MVPRPMVTTRFQGTHVDASPEERLQRHELTVAIPSSGPVRYPITVIATAGMAQAP